MTVGGREIEGKEREVEREVEREGGRVGGGGEGGGEQGSEVIFIISRERTARPAGPLVAL